MPLDSSCYDIYKHIKCKYGIISNEKTARVRVFLCWFVKEQTRFLQNKYVLISRRRMFAISISFKIEYTFC
jgi:hypothetical protein